MYVIQPAHSWWSGQNWKDAQPLPEGFRYGSDSNSRWLTSEELHALIDGTEIPAAEKLRVVAPLRARA
jgi:UDP-N-acetylglucosamine 4,6-dehydratase